MSSARTPGYESSALPTPALASIVFIVNDDVSVRESLELLVRSENWRPETFASAQEFLNHPRTLVPSCLVLDLSLPGLNGLDLQRQLAVEHVDMPIIFITGNGDVPKSVQPMKAGALEFLTKPLDSNALISAIRNALERSRLALAQDAAMQELRDRYASLTHRERKVMALVVSGLLNKQVGAELGISEITVKAHRGQVMQKMKANSLADLVRMAGELGPARRQFMRHDGNFTRLRHQTHSSASSQCPGYSFMSKGVFVKSRNRMVRLSRGDGDR